MPTNVRCDEPLLGDLLGYASDSSFDTWDGSEYEKAYSAAITATSTGIVSAGTIGWSGQSEKSYNSSHLHVAAGGGPLRGGSSRDDSDDDSRSIGTFTTVDDAWYDKDVYKIGDRVEVKRIDLIKMGERRARTTGISRQDVLDGVRGGVAAPDGMRFGPVEPQQLYESKDREIWGKSRREEEEVGQDVKKSATELDIANYKSWLGLQEPRIRQ